ncbi:MAG: adenylyl-sulfate kinase [Candidatus Brocadia sp. AMX2]|uniref:Adenylyl-sulfate kinase n=1 Tax=Candidatus Brocadia sinica JPN1 TaxID=1197129 RepID=A0ABQ0JZJ5_9BACT|nr:MULTISPECIES: adenylyl-sulfate kinase [Brocadia]KXK27863.1 MAG: adenylylsulfate kinase [Candidatus Brocadia sinica]MBC6933678.1 adenylyl-sulfate kinase [Candidatus Brocadia sp.]MBL1170469.1 adenylyl-sulfate kinase [Candidatus Brocadia sp. AMX1]NOG40064.1 adenylyl-sulfate kinase [Planctomycetota bacterium]KAA0243110.1 MAG: adenylyl-sulfate kinase [Candidatus Brocadia sp. AMX2]
MNKGFTVWLTGLSGSGKSAISHFLGKRLKELGRNAEILDGDVVRANLCQGLDFRKQDQDIYVQRVAFVCKLLTRNGVSVISSVISPYREGRENARKEIDNFVEVYTKCPTEVCAQRDVEGMHKKVLKGEIQDFPGASDPYEEPLNPDLIVETDKETVEESTNKIVNKLIELGYLNQKGSVSHVYSPEEEEKIKERLSRLGYI